ncbi:MAG: hypothetical protein K2N48_10460, partial [Muribaculaceae bacterium]|nr:hypothetical protein [Muribaculaceae bacterium]
MPKKKEAPEIEVELSKNPPKKKTLVKKWFDETAVTNTEDLRIVCELVARSAYEQFRMTVSSGNIEVFGIIFYATFESILEFIRSKQKTYNRFTMEIMNSINIGYTNNSDEENEKVGNFMPIMEHIGVNKNIVNDNTTITESSTNQAFKRGTEQNIK